MDTPKAKANIPAGGGVRQETKVENRARTVGSPIVFSPAAWAARTDHYRESCCVADRDAASTEET
eukprot:3514222-Alexandrium_andersonii.AAC.1